MSRAAKRENFYRRDPAAALAGMAGMTLEERGVYNTIIDLLYLTWRPVEDSRAYLAGHCGCAIQKLNPILRRLIESGKLMTFQEGGQTYISNGHFETERTAVKGVTTRSGRGDVGEKSEGVGEKSTSVAENPPGCENNVEEIEPVAPLEKTRLDQTRVEPSSSKAGVPEWKEMLAQAVEAAGDMADMTAIPMQHAADLRAIVEPNSGEPCTWDEVLTAIGLLAARQRQRGKPIKSWAWVRDDALALRDKRLNAVNPAPNVVPIGAGRTSFAEQLGLDQAEARRLAFAKLDAMEAERG